MNRSLPQAVFSLLCQQPVVSGQALANSLNVTRTAIWKAIEYLRACGLPVVAESRHGYRLLCQRSIQPLEIEALQRLLPEHMGLRLLFETGSTNDDVRNELTDSFVLAEYQQQGRGRMGRQWRSVPGCSIVLSGRWTFTSGIANLAGLNLAVASAVLQTISAHGWRPGVKWPNDLVLPKSTGKLHKVGGILIEVHGEMEGPCQAVVGLGLNWSLPKDAQQSINQPVANLVDLPRTNNTKPPDRSTFVAHLLPALDKAVRHWCESGSSRLSTDRQAILDIWQQYDVLHSQPVCLVASGAKSSSLRGIYRGVTEHGSLLLETRDGLRIVHSGEVSLRPEPAKNCTKNH